MPNISRSVYLLPAAAASMGIIKQGGDLGVRGGPDTLAARDLCVREFCLEDSWGMKHSLIIIREVSILTLFVHVCRTAVHCRDVFL